MRSVGKLILIGVTASWLFGCGSGASTPSRNGGSPTLFSRGRRRRDGQRRGKCERRSRGVQWRARRGRWRDSGSGAGGPTGTGGGPSTGCGTSTSLQNGRASIDVSGTPRDYILALPNNTTRAPLPAGIQLAPRAAWPMTAQQERRPNITGCRGGQPTRPSSSRPRGSTTAGPTRAAATSLFSRRCSRTSKPTFASISRASSPPDSATAA